MAIAGRTRHLTKNLTNPYMSETLHTDRSTANYGNVYTKEHGRTYFGDVPGDRRVVEVIVDVVVHATWHAL
jgi:hypothetical protein